MKKIYLLRHANSIRKLTQQDHDREITDKGVVEIQRLSAFLHDKKFAADKVFCSTAVRAKQTWNTLSIIGGYTIDTEYLEELYNPSFEEFMKCLSEIDDNYDTVLVVSHNPAISEVVNSIIDSSFIAFGTSNCGAVNANINSWSEIKEGCGELEWIFSADLS